MEADTLRALRVQPGGVTGEVDGPQGVTTRLRPAAKRRKGERFRPYEPKVSLGLSGAMRDKLAP